MSALLTRPSLNHETAENQLEQRIRRHLTADARAIGRLQIEVDGGVVTLRGTATSFYQKQLWLHGTKRVVGDEALIDDQVTVTPSWEETDLAWRD